MSDNIGYDDVSQEPTPEELAEHDAAVERMGPNDGMAPIPQSPEELAAVEKHRAEWERKDKERRANELIEKATREAQNKELHDQRVAEHRKAQEPKG